MNSTASRNPLRSERPIRAALLALAALSLTILPARAAIDPAISQAAWRMAHGVTSAQLANATWMAEDPDRDGQTNAQECVAGTHPFVGTSVVAISGTAVNGSIAQLTFPTVIGKNYFLQKSSNLKDASWSTVITALVVGDGNPRTLNVGREARCFYRVLVQDYDSDGDGVADYAEEILHFNPQNQYTGGPGSPSDHAVITAALGQPNVVTVTPDDAAASEDGPKSGRIVVRRTGSFDPLTVPVAVSGSATPDTDYAALPPTVTLPVGVNSATLYVMPIADALPEGGEVVTVTPSGGAGYSLSGPTAASVLIADATAPVGGGLTGRYYDTSNATYAHADNFDPAQLKATRIDPTVDFVWNTGVPGASTLGTAASDNWSARFDSYLVPTSTGDHVFEVQADDGARVYVNGALVIDAWAQGSATTTPMQSVPIALTAGVAVPVRVEYYELFGNASVALRWRTPGPGAATAIPLAATYLDAGTTINGWTAQYWDNASLIGLPRFGDYPNAITLNWTTSQPTATLPSADNFSIKWEGFLRPAITGAYTFDVRADESARVYVNDVLVLDASVPGSATTVPIESAAQSLTGGVRYPVRVEFADTTGASAMVLRWKPPGASTYAAIPLANIFRVADPAVPTNGYWATYYGNAAHAGKPTFSVQDTASPSLNYSAFATAAPASNLGTTTGNNWSANIAGFVQPSATGAYRFSLQADDGARLYVNDVLLLDGWAPGSATAAALTSVDVPLTAGVATPIRVEYYELTGNASVTVNWRQPGATTYTPIPTASYFRDAALTTAGLSGTYWRNASLAGPPYFHDHPASLTANWAATQPSVTPTAVSFSAKWEGWLAPTTTGNFLFDIQASDGARVYLDGNLIIDAWTANSSLAAPLVSAPVALTAGSRYPIRVEFYDAQTEAIVRLRWIPAGGTSFVAIPAANVMREATGSFPGWLATYYTNTTLTPPYSHAAVEGAVTYDFGSGAPIEPGMEPDTFSVRWTGQVQPQYSEEYTFVVNCDDSAKLFLNGQQQTLLRADTNVAVDWPTNITTTDRYVRIPLVGGQRYDIQLDFFESTGTATCRLYWYSPSQPRQIIPQSRLYPTSTTPAPAVVMSPTVASALVGGPFSYAIQSNNNGYIVSVTRLPAWLTRSGGIISGTPPVGAQGNYQILITVSNSTGTSQSLLNLSVADTGRTITREYWNGIPGVGVGSIPVDTAPSGTETLTSLQGPTNFGDDYGARIRGYLTAPATGNYYFWIAGDDSAELWISNDDDPVNKLKRAHVSGGTPALTWNAEPNQKSPWLALESGKRYYVEILHKAGTGAGDNLAVGWLKPGQSGSAPSEVVPAYVLSPYVEPTPGSSPGTLYVATMLAQGGAETNGVGTSTLRLSPDETVAYIRFDHHGMTGPLTDWHVHSDPFLTSGSQIIYDGAEPLPGDGPQPDGSHKWNIVASGPLSVEDVRELIKQGKAYINLHTAAYMNGEIRGNYTLANGSRTFTPPPPPSGWTDDHLDNAAASRFLTQATFGPSVADIGALKGIAVAPYATGYEAWLEDQFTKPATLQLPEVLGRVLSNYNNPFDETLSFNAWWRSSIGGDDQLRQRVAFALSEILVVSAQGLLADNARALSYYYDLLAQNAFGNFRDILETVSYSPTMGRYLDALRNDKPDQGVGRIPNENYAREIKQLFSIGLFRMWPDGSLVLNSQEQLVPTYTQNEIVGFAHVFTGLDYGYDGAFRTTLGAAADWTRQMREVPARHFTGPKRILNNEVLPGLASVGGQPLDPYATHVAAQYNDPAYQALPTQELDAVHDQLFNHPNTGPFICRQLIQRLVMSHPPRDYLYRVVQKFNDNGAGVRGDMKAVIKAILLDYDARSPLAISKPDAGKQREPLLRVAAAARAFRTQPITGTYAQNGTRALTITTTAPHRLTTNNNVFLEFNDVSPAGTPMPTSTVYTVGSILGSQNTSTQFTVNLAEWISGTYSQPAGSTTVTVTLSSHWLDYGLRAYFKCVTGGGMGVLDGLQTITSYYAGSTTTFTFTAPAAAPTLRTGSCILPRFTASYVVTASGQTAPIDRRITMNTSRNHNFAVGDRISLNFSNGNPLPIDGEFVVDTVVDHDTFTVLGSSTGSNLVNQQENTIYIFPHLPQPLVRNGNLGGRASTYALGSTENDISQTPINAPTVFNYFLPDFKFPGALASQGLTTPEFEDTSETNVIRQANFMWNGVMNPGNTNGISSFRTGSNALVMDFGPWMGNATDIGLGAGPTPAVPWTNDQNIGALIDKMNMLLLGGQLPAAGKSIIQTFITANTGTNAYTNITYNNMTPTDTHKRDRIRAVIHLLISSADYNIQR